MNGNSFPIFHWSPTTRRNQITKTGLTPGALSTDRVWRPPYICYSDDPKLAWALSAMTERGLAVPSWDLWQTWSDVPSGMEHIPFDIGSYDDGKVKEYRVYERIYKRDLWMVGTKMRNR